MKKAPNVRLSLRKLLIATLAVGPLAVLPGPVWAAIPTSSSFTVTNGSATVSAAGLIANINASDRAVLVWNAGAFNIGATETYNFNLPSGGAILNRVGYTTTGALGAVDTATINGTLLSNGRVFVLANGNIVVGSGATINTAGLVLSTLEETSDGPFITLGNLVLSGASKGNISLGNVTVAGNLSAYAGGFVSGLVTGSSAATSAATLTGGAVTAISTPATPGSGYTVAPTVIITPAAGDPGAGATATATIDGTGAVTGITVTAGGAGYLVAPTISFSANPNVAPNSVGGLAGAGATTVTGDLVLRAVTASSGINLANGGALTVGGNLTVTTNNGALTQTGALLIGNTTAASQVASFTTGNNTVTLTNAANDFQVVQVATGNATTTTGSVSLVDANIIRLGDSTVGGALSVSVLGNSTLSGTAIGTTGAVVVGGNADFLSTGAPAASGSQAAITIANNSSVGGTLTGVVTGNGAFSFTGTGNSTTNTLTVGTITSNNGTSGGNRTGVTINTTSNLTVTGTLSALSNNTTNGDGGGITLTGAHINTSTGTLNGGNATRAGQVTLNATAGNITLGAVNSFNRVSLRASDSISQAAGTVITTINNTLSSGNAVTHLLNATNSITLNNANSFAANSAIAVTAGANSGVTNINNTILGNTNVTGNLGVTVTGGATSIQLGVGSGTAAQPINVSGVLTATTGGGAITDNDSSRFVVPGGLSLNSANGAVTLDAATSILAPSVQLGQVNVNAGTGAVSIAETTTLNLGNITASSLTARSTEGGIVRSGTITLTGTGTFRVPSTQSVILDGTANTIPTLNVIGGNDNQVALAAGSTLGGSTNVTGNLTVTTASGAGLAIAAPTITGNLTVNAGGDITVTAPTTVTGNLNLTTLSTLGTAISQPGTTFTGSGVTTNVTASPGSLTVTGTTTLNSAGTVALTGSNDFNTVVLNNATSTAPVTIHDINNLTVSGTASGAAVTVVAGALGATSVGNPWNLTLGNLHVAGLTASAAAGAADGNSGTVTQASGTSIHSFGTTTFNTKNNNIIIGNNGNNFGQVNVSVGSTDGSRTVTLVEDGTMKLGSFSSRGSSSITSRFGSIIEDPDASITITNNGTLTLSAPSGSILIGNTTKTGAFTTGGNVVTVVANAPTGAVAVQSSANLTLGNITSLSLTAASGNNLTQNGRLNIFGTSTFSASRGITLTNNTNNFGRVFLTTTNSTTGNISITEAGTLNLGGVTQAAGGSTTFTATSLFGDIIDTGLGGVKPGGTVASVGSGVVTLSAVNGNIVLDDPTTDFPTSGGVVFSGMNVTLSPLGGTTGAPLTLVLGAANSTSSAGNLTVTTAIGHIGNAGNLSVSGDAFFQTGSGNITVNQAGNQFGTVRFTGNQIRITQANNMNIATGSSATGLAELTSGGNITIVNRGGSVSLAQTGNFTAAGTIVLPKLIQAGQALVVNSPATKDLSALSLSADLAGKTPVNYGAGTYLPPNP